MVHLVYFFGKFGAAWTKISNLHQNSFNNRTSKDLKNKYYHLKTFNSNKLEYLKSKARSLGEDELKYEESFEKNKYIRWTIQDIGCVNYSINF